MKRLLISTLTVTLCGCVLAVDGKGPLIGDGIYSYYTNEFVQEYSANYEYVYPAAKKTIEELKYIIVTNQKEALQAFIEARQPDDSPVKITIKFMGGSVTKVVIRVGEAALDSNRIAARAIRNKIAEKLTKK